jgi:ankyrin repeat protein
MSAANPADPRSLWLNSPDALLQVLCCVAFCGHDASNFSSLTRAFRGDEVLWGCIKDRRRLMGRTVLMACSRSGDITRVRWLLDRSADVNAADTGDGWTSLVLASFNGRLEVVRELLGRGANVEAAMTIGWTPLMWACEKGHLEIVRELLEQGANVNAALTSNCRTSLMSACQSGHLEIVRELLGRGANVNAGQSNGWTSLMWACHQGHLEIARLFLAHHASKATVNRYGRTAYDYSFEADAELRALVKP